MQVNETGCCGRIASSGGYKRSQQREQVRKMFLRSTLLKFSPPLWKKIFPGFSKAGVFQIKPAGDH